MFADEQIAVHSVAIRKSGRQARPRVASVTPNIWPIKPISEISYDAVPLDTLRAKICSDLNSLASTIPNEEVRIVAIDVADESDDEFRQAQEIGINE